MPRKRKPIDLSIEPGEIVLSGPNDLDELPAISVTAEIVDDTAPSAAMVIERVPMESLNLDPGNVRKGKVGPIIDSLIEFGQHRPLVVQRSTREIIVGNHTYKAAEHLGWTEIDVLFVDDDELKALRRSLADNRTGELAEWDELGLLGKLRITGDDVPGFDLEFREALEAKFDTTLDSLEDPIYPITPKFEETHQAIVIFADRDSDWAKLCEILHLEEKKSYKTNTVGFCQVIDAETFLGIWHSKDRRDVTVTDYGDMDDYFTL